MPRSSCSRDSPTATQAARLPEPRGAWRRSLASTCLPLGGRGLVDGEVDQLGRTRPPTFPGGTSRLFQMPVSALPATPRHFSRRLRVDQLGRARGGPDQPVLDKQCRVAGYVADAACRGVVGRSVAGRAARGRRSTASGSVVEAMRDPGRTSETRGLTVAVAMEQSDEPDFGIQ